MVWLVMDSLKLSNVSTCLQAKKNPYHYDICDKSFSQTSSLCKQANTTIKNIFYEAFQLQLIEISQNYWLEIYHKIEIKKKLHMLQ
ncbi:---NA--- [Octopus vulgaris]|uniref:---NA n=1 Tax=Octopus vulgaris TaxID=6645 RepID=A0AA36B5T4_OCTVU|nr:---NA--- [Octopus vulgaris]